MNELATKETITSLELVKEINMFREQEGNRAELQHCDLLKVIRDEFEEEIGVGNIYKSYYMNTQNKKQPMYVLTYPQAKQLLVRCKVKPTKEFCDKYNLDIEYNIISKTRFEISFGNMLVEALKEFEIEVISQYRVDNYIIDFYIPSKNIAVEYDEQQHLTKANQTKDIERQKYISDKMECKFIRCDYRDSDIKNVIKVIKEVM